jgi:hypothetical protein
VRALRAMPRLTAPPGRRVPADLAREYRALCIRARAVTADTLRGEFLSIWEAFTELAEAYGLCTMSDSIN